jgi:hypothetical protein
MLDDLRETFLEPWQPASCAALAEWTACYAMFLVYAWQAHGGFLMVDNANLIVHEGGHGLFGWFGETLGLWGGTILELLVPMLLAASFAYKRQTTATAFCLFIFFENFLYIATYMSDARSQALPLVSLGGDEPINDWFLMLGQIGLLEHEQVLSRLVRYAGWIGMIATVGWMWLRGSQAEKARAARA